MHIPYAYRYNTTKNCTTKLRHYCGRCNGERHSYIHIHIHTVYTRTYAYAYAYTNKQPEICVIIVEGIRKGEILILICIYIYVCVYIYIYIQKHTYTQKTRKLRHYCGRYDGGRYSSCRGMYACICIYIYIYIYVYVLY